MLLSVLLIFPRGALCAYGPPVLFLSLRLTSSVASRAFPAAEPSAWLTSCLVASVAPSALAAVSSTARLTSSLAGRLAAGVSVERHVEADGE